MRFDKVEDRKEGLLRIPPIAPVRRLAQLVPRRNRWVKLVVGLEIVRAIVSVGAQILGKAFHIRGHDGRVGSRHLWRIAVLVRRAHVMGSDGNRIHPRNDGRACRSAHPSRGKRLAPPHPLRRQSIDMRRARHRITVAAVIRVRIFKGYP